MADHLTNRVLPAEQRRSLAELTDDLDLTAGDRATKSSAFWTMLTLSSVIAVSGVLADSTATVIGAMIIAPLSTPIMGIALGVAIREPGMAARSAKYVLAGAALVIGIGVTFSFFLPGTFDPLSNAQIVGRTSPGLLDLVAALATGLAGAVALARRDVAAVLPGVAIAISLVPPLGVVGVCFGQAQWALGIGALVLFLSNVLALVLAGTIVFAVLASTGSGEIQLSRRRTYATLGVLLALIAIPLVANTVGVWLVQLWTSRVYEAAQVWVDDVPGTTVEDIEVVSNVVYVTVKTSGDLPPGDTLVASLDGQIPDGVEVVITTTLGERIDAGTVGVSSPN